MLLVADGDSLAQRAVVARLMARVKGVCHSVLRDRADADDQVQVTLLQVLRSASTYRGEGSLEGWADRIAVRNAMRAVAARRRTIERVAEDIEPDDVATAAAESDVSEGASRAATVYLQSLPETTRTVLTLRHQLGYSVPEIAELTGVSPNTVKDRLVRGREQLRKLVRRQRVIGARGWDD